MLSKLDQLEALSQHGYGLMWHPIHRDFRPIVVEADGTIEWQHDPCVIGGSLHIIEDLYEIVAGE